MRAAQNIKKASQTSFCLTLPLATCAFRIGAHRSLVQASCTGCVCTATGAAHAGSSICEGRDSKGLCTLPTFPQLTQYLQASYPSLLQHNAHKHHQQPQKTCTSTHTHTHLWVIATTCLSLQQHASTHTWVLGSPFFCCSSASTSSSLALLHQGLLNCTNSKSNSAAQQAHTHTQILYLM